MLYYAAGKAAQYAGRQLRSGATAAARRAMNIAYKKAGEYVSGKRKRAAPKASDPPAYQSKRVERGRNGRRFKSAVHGRWAGRVKTKNKPMALDRFNRYGVVLKSEIVGNATDDNCVYALTDVMRPVDAIYWAVASVIRLLFEKAGIRITGLEESPVTVSQGFASIPEYIIMLHMFNKVTGNSVSAVTYTTVSTSTFQNVVDAFLGKVEEYIVGYGVADNNNAFELNAFTLHKLSSTVGEPVVPTSVLLSTVYCGEVHLQCFASCDFKVQNRTVGYSGSEDAENVGSNPIVGRFYKFAGLPNFKNDSFKVGGTVMNTQPFGSLAGDKGLSCFGGTGTTPSSTFRTPPEPGMFWNCTSHSKVRLDPGQVKEVREIYSKKIMFLSFLQKMKYNTAYGYYGYTVFPSIMMSFEDVINTDTTYDIKIAVEVSRTLGFIASEKRRKWMKSSFNILSPVNP